MTVTNILTRLVSSKSADRKPRRREQAGMALTGLQRLEERHAFSVGSFLPECPMPTAQVGGAAALVVSAPADRAGNTLAKARAITVSETAASFSDWVGRTDRNDYYRFTIRDRSDFSLVMNGMTSDADVSLLDASGRVITTSGAPGTLPESIAMPLDAGTYAIRVVPYVGGTNYRLGVSATSVARPDQAGNTMAAARAIAVGDQASTFADWVGRADRDDFYRFTVASASDFRLALEGMSSDADVTLLDASGRVLTGSYRCGANDEAIERRLDSGDYFIRVVPYDGETTYRLTVSATSVAPPDFAGNTQATGRSITLSPAVSTFRDWVGGADPSDYYCFNLAENAAVSLTVAGLAADADVVLLDRSGQEVARSSTAGTAAEAIERSLTSGQYAIHVVRRTGDTPYSLSVSARSVQPTPLDWFTANVHDLELGPLARALAADGKLDRFDMIALFRATRDQGAVDATELTDLRVLVNNASRFQMPDDVRFLSNCIANGNVANVRSGIGDLVAGSNQSRLDSLVGKWFLGTDRPDTNYTYSVVAGSLFQNGPNADDVDQNAIGDCYFMATLSSIAQEKPDTIRNMFIDNGDNTWGVRFYHDGVAEYVTVDRSLPTLGGMQIYAGWGGGGVSCPANELWVALAEKAYAQLGELGWSRPSDARNEYAAIEGGWMDYVIEQVTGLGSATWNATQMTQAQLVGIVNSNQVVTAGFVDGAGFGVVNGHAYSITSYDAATGRFRLRNPWGTSHADVTFPQLQQLRGWVMASTR